MFLQLFDFKVSSKQDSRGSYAEAPAYIAPLSQSLSVASSDERCGQFAMDVKLLECVQRHETFKASHGKPRELC